MAENFQWWLRFPPEVVRERFSVWLTLPVVPEGWVRVLEANGWFYADCREQDLENILEGWSEESLHFLRHDEWLEFLQAQFGETALRELDCSPYKN